MAKKKKSVVKKSLPSKTKKAKVSVIDKTKTINSIKKKKEENNFMSKKTNGSENTNSAIDLTVVAKEQPTKKTGQPLSDAALLRARNRALAKAKEAIKEKEKSNHIQYTDKVAYEKQIKLAEPKHKLVLEYIIHASLPLLYEFITTSSGLSEWFADDVNIKGNVYSFLWDGAQQEARVLAIKENKFVRFQWTDRAPNTYFEFRIEKNELTEELSLIITDFAESADEMNSLEVLWQGQISRLMKVLGSKF